MAKTEIAKRPDVLTLFKTHASDGDLSKADDAIPEFMRPAMAEKTGLAEMREFIRPPRLKILQPMTSGEVTEVYGVGDAIILPSMQLVASMDRDPKTGKPKEEGTPFHFVPLMFWPEWCLWNPIQMRGQAPMIEASTMDPNSDIAKRARIPEMRLEPHPERQDLDRRYVEHLNFLFLTLDVEEVHGQPFVVSFSRAEHKTGTTLMSMILGRKAPPYGSIFSARVRPRTNEKGTWYGLTIGNPAEGNPRFVTHKDLYEKFEDMFTQMKEAIDKRRVIVEHDEPEEEGAQIVDSEF